MLLLELSSCDVFTTDLSPFQQKSVFDNNKFSNVDNVASLTILSMLSKLANFIISNVS
jgi:hypothetical protein